MANGNGHEHRRRTDEHGVQLHERKTDSDYIARVGEFGSRWKLQWLVVAAAFTWYSKNILEPVRVTAQTTTEVRELRSMISAQVIPRLDSADVDRKRLIDSQIQQGRILGYLSRMQCLQLDAYDRVKADLDCRDIPVPPAAPAPQKRE